MSEGEMIFDAACGSGGLLLEAFKYFKKQGNTNHEQQTNWENSIRDYEQNITFLRLGIMNLFLHELNLPNRHEEELTDNALKQFDFVVSSSHWHTTHFQPIDAVREVRKLLDFLKPSGKLGICLPPNAFDLAVQEFCKANAFTIHREVKTFDVHGQTVEILLLVLKKFTDEEAYYFFQRKSQKRLSDFRPTQSTASTLCLLPIDDYIDDYHELRFELLCYKRRGIGFQDWFSNIMRKYDPTFVAVKSSGKEGDWKCDGFSEDTKTVYQCYAPERLKVSTLINKINEDFKGAKEKWKSKMKCWIFVWSNHEALPPNVLDLLQDLKNDNPDILIDHWDKEKFWGIFKLISREEREKLLGISSYGKLNFLKNGE